MARGNKTTTPAFAVPTDDTNLDLNRSVRPEDSILARGETIGPRKETALERFTRFATGDFNRENVFGRKKLPDTLTDVKETPIESSSPLNLDRETEIQNSLESLSNDAANTDDIIPFKTGVDSQLQSIDDTKEKVEEAAITERTRLTGTLAEELEKLTGKGDRLLEERDEELGTQEQDLANLRNEIVGLSSEFDQLIGSQEGRGRTKIFVSGKQAQIARQKAVVIGGKASLLLAMQGNIAASRAKAQETVDLEFAELEQSIANTRELLALNEPEFTAAQNREAARVKAELDKEAALIQDAKDEKNNIFDLAISAAENGADQETMNAIINSKTLAEAMANSGSFLAPPASNEPLTKTVGDTLLQYNPLTNTWSEVFKAPEESEIVKINGVDYIKKTDANGNPVLTKIEVPPTPVDESTITALDIQINLINDILDSSGLNSAVGANAAARFAVADAFGAKTDAINSIKSLISNETLNKLIAVKAAGATFGALSDRELDVIASAGSTIGASAVTDDNGNIVGYQMTQDAFDKEIKRLRLASQNFMSLNNTNIPVAERIQDFYNNNPDKRAEIDALDSITSPETGLPLTEEEKAQVLGISFNQARTQNSVSPVNIQPVTIGNTTANVDSSIRSRLEAADDAFFKATGKHLKINQSFRSREQQAELFRRSQAGEIGRAAPPGSSFHEKGLAIDVTNWKEAEPFLRQFGFLNNLADDKGHFSIGEFNNNIS